MRALEPGRWPWLLAHELRILWRAFGIRSRLVVVLAILLVVLVHVGGFAAARGRLLELLLQRTPAAAIILTAVTLLLVQSIAFALAVRAFFERGDLDLLLSSPVPARHVFAARGVAVAAGSAAALALFLLPVANGGALLGRWRLLAIYPTVAAIGLACAALAFAVTLLLVRRLGVRRARTWAQVLGALVGAGIALAMQLGPLLPAPARHALSEWAVAGGGGWLGAASPLLWPWRAMVGDPVALAIVLAIGVGAFALVVGWGAPLFIEAAQDAPASPRSPGTARPVHFGAGLAATVVRKELRLLVRDPLLVGKALLQVLYLVPLFVLLVRGTQPLELLAGALVLLAATLAATFGWMSVSGEEAPDLLRSAPVPLGRLRLLKVLAAMLPVMALVAPLLAWMLLRAPASGALVALFAMAAMAGSAAVQVWATPLAAGRDLRAKAPRDIVMRVVDMLGSFAWAAACYAALRGSAWAAAAALGGLAAPACAWLASRRRD